MIESENPIDHKPGTIYSCDNRLFGAARRLCPLHRAGAAMQQVLESVLHQLATDSDLDDTVSAPEKYDALEAQVRAVLDLARSEQAW